MPTSSPSLWAEIIELMILGSVKEYMATYALSLASANRSQIAWTQLRSLDLLGVFPREK
jgi:hypothetical protein